MSQLTTQQQVGARRVPDQARHMIDKIFENLTASCPILLTINREQLEILKQQWILGFAENGIKTFEQVKRGMAAVRAKQNGYLPSVGEFVAWCNDIDYHALGLPTEAELVARLKSFSGYAKYDEHKFKYRSKAEYWLLSTIYNKCWNKREEDLLNAAPKALKDAAEKVKSGYEFPEIPVAIEQKIVTLPQEKTLKHIANCKAALRGQAA